MNQVYQMLEKLSALAKQDPLLRCQLLNTREAGDPLDAFCTLATAVGCPISIGELVAVGQEYSDNQCKSTNGGNPTPYESFDDTYEIFLASL